MKKLFTLFLVIAFSHANSQAFDWASTGGGVQSDIANSVAVDAFGNVFTTGYFANTCNFDPGATNYTVASAGANDVYIEKRNSAGVLQWVRTLGNINTENAKSIAVDGSSNVYITGYFNGIVDFDPGAGTYTIAAVASADAFVLKLNTIGNFVWARSFSGPGVDQGNAIAVNNSGDVYTTGNFSQIIDMDPSASSFTLNSGNANFSTYDVYISKLNSSGNFVWARQITSVASTHDYGNDITLDASGNVYVAGDLSANSVVDLDPGATSYTVQGTGTTLDAFYIKLNPAGAFQYGGAIGGNLDEHGYGIDVDASNGPVLTGYAESATIDLNPGAGVNTFTMAGVRDIFIVKLNSTGTFSWADLIGSTGSDQGRGVSVDASGNIYVTGGFSGTVDFDPGASTDNHTATGGSDIFLLKLNNAGALIWALDIGGTSNDYGLEITSDGSGYTYNCGYFGQTVDFDPGTPVYNVMTAGSDDTYTLKLMPCATPTLTVSGTTTLCAGGSTTLTASGASTYSWSTGATTTTISLNPTVTTVYTVTGTTGLCSTVTTRTISVTSNPTVNIAASSPSICSGSSTNLTASGASTYSWSTGATTTVTSVSPTITTVYTATGTAVSGCRDTQTISISVTANPTVNISASSSTVCSGSSATLTASGASTYSWSTGATTTVTSVSPSITTVYTATGTAASGCRDTQTISITPVANPTVNITASSPSICSGSSTNLTVSGASTYSWSTGATTTVTSVSPSITTVYTATGTAASGCRDTQTISVNVTTTPTLTTTHYTICAGGTATLSASGATTYSWSTGATVSSITVAPAANATYTVVGNNGACSDVNTVSVTVGSSISIAVTPTAPAVCIGNSLTLSATGATSYTWSTGSNSTSIAVSPTINTTYTINGTSGSCSGSRTITVVANANPTVVATSSSSLICTGNSVTLNATGANTYNWNPGSLPGSSVAVSPTITTTYSVTGTSTAGCTNTKTLSVTVSACTGIEEELTEKEFWVYPNPASSVVNVLFPNFSGDTKIELIDITGKVIKSDIISETQTEINVSDLNSGMYFIKIRSKEKEVIKKIIKE